MHVIITYNSNSIRRSTTGLLIYIYNNFTSTITLDLFVFFVRVYNLCIKKFEKMFSFCIKTERLINMRATVFFFFL